MDTLAAYSLTYSFMVTVHTDIKADYTCRLNGVYTGQREDVCLNTVPGDEGATGVLTFLWHIR